MTAACAVLSDFRSTTPAHPAPPPPPRSRTRRHASRYRYVRYCKAGGYQARVPLGVSHELARGKGESVNLGLYTRADWGSSEEAEWAAGRAAKEFVRRNLPGRDLCDVLDSLKADRLVPAILMPTWVFARPDGRFGAKVRRRGRAFEVGPFDTAKAAYHAIRAVVVREFPLRPRLIDVTPPVGRPGPVGVDPPAVAG